MPNLPTTFTFGRFTIPASQVFYLSSSRLSYGLVNLKPLIPGHVLICPVRRIPRLSQLTSKETADLFNTVRRVSKTLERLYQASSFNVAIQDGIDAGQSVSHVHVHIIPRIKGDFDGQNDQVYDLLEGDEGDIGGELRKRKEKRKGFGTPDVDRKPRSEKEMSDEANWLRKEMEKDSTEFEEDELKLNGG